MRVAVMCAPGEVGIEDRPDPNILALPMRSTAGPRPASAGRTCGLTGVFESIDRPLPMGHECVGIVEEVGSEVRRIRASRPAVPLAGPLEASIDCRRHLQAPSLARTIDSIHLRPTVRSPQPERIRQ